MDKRLREEITIMFHTASDDLLALLIKTADEANFLEEHDR